MHTKQLLAKGLAVAVILTGSLQSAPRLILQESSFDFGYVPQGARISHVFWLKSAGDDTLKILKVMPGCGCTKAPLETSVLAPGDSTRLEVVFNTGKYRNRVAKEPRIETNEGSTSKFVRISANVIAPPDSTCPIVITPPQLDLSEPGLADRQAPSLSILNVSERSFNVRLVDWPKGLVSVELPEVIAAGKTAPAQVRLLEKAPNESFEKSITLELDDAEHSRFTIPIKRTVRALGTR